MSESYNVSWRLELENGSVGGVAGTLSPFAHTDAVPSSDHIDLNDFENGWYVDTAQLCKKGAAGCTKNPDGSYNLKLVAEFTPQRWFYVGSIISGVTLVGCVGYLLYAWRKGNKAKTYHVKR
jgi:hypothetical protein